jgi:phosphoesterase RecJ-like protein
MVTTHVRPDGDAIGSLLGLGLALQQAGKDVQMVSADGVPMSFRHLSGSEQVDTQCVEEVDLIIAVDCSDLSRVGKILDGRSAPDINIDHHVTNLGFARINLVEPKSVATAEIIAGHLNDWGLPLTRDVAAALLTGMITDTLGFRTANMTPKALRMAADLMEVGVDLPDLYLKALVQRSFEAARFWGMGLSHVEREDGLIWTTLSMADRQAVGYPGRDDADLINMLSAITGVVICVIFVEQPHGRTKISWRSQPGFDVSEVALKFGGGGHPNASGAEISGNLEEIRELVLKETRILLNMEEFVRSNVAI